MTDRADRRTTGRPPKAAAVTEDQMAILRAEWLSTRQLRDVLARAREIDPAIDVDWMRYRFGTRSGDGYGPWYTSDRPSPRGAQ